MLRMQREQAIKARTLRAAASAPTAIRPPPPPQFDDEIISRNECKLKAGDELNFATLEKDTNLCVEWYYAKNGGDEANRWSDDDSEVDDDERNDGDDSEMKARRRVNDDDDDGTDSASVNRKRKLMMMMANARPRSAAERFLIRPGKRASSFTQKMMRFANFTEAL